MVLTERSSKFDLKRPKTDPPLPRSSACAPPAQRLSLANPFAPCPQQAAGSQPNEVDLVMKGLLAQPGVTAYLIINADGTCRHRRAPWVERLRLTERARDTAHVHTELVCAQRSLLARTHAMRNTSSDRDSNPSRILRPQASPSSTTTWTTTKPSTSPPSSPTSPQSPSNTSGSSSTTARQVPLAVCRFLCRFASHTSHG